MMRLAFLKTHVRYLALLVAFFLGTVSVNESAVYAQTDISGGAQATSPPKKDPPLRAPQQVDAKTSPRPRPASVKPDALIDIIKAQQKNNVRESVGTAEGQNFSEEDLKRFVAEKKVDEIKAKLRKDPDFSAVLSAIKALSQDKRIELLNRGLNTFKKTWAELGKISPEGQTEAGQKAEKMIAEAIVDLVKEMLKLPKTV